MDGERKRRRFAHAQEVPQFGKQRDGLGAGEFFGPKNARSQRPFDLLPLIRLHDLIDDVRCHHECEAGQPPREIETPDVHQVDEDVRVFGFLQPDLCYLDG
jgi:hypothetical protein